jgi:hypothetical protein
MMRAVGLGGAEHQLGEWQIEQRGDLLARPVGSRFRAGLGCVCHPNPCLWNPAALALGIFR